MSSLQPTAADSYAEAISQGRMRIESDQAGTYLVDRKTAERVELLSFQLTEDGVREAIGDLLGWPDVG